MKRLLILAAAVLLFSTPARAAVIFLDTFDTENGGAGVINYTSFANWTVTDGSVDLIGNGFFDFQPGNGLYIDMDGSTGDAGLMSVDPIPVAAGSYLLEFDIAGSWRTPGTEGVLFEIFGTSVTYVTGSVTAFSPDIPFTHIALPFVVGAPDGLRFSFEGVGGDNIGLLLDNVQLTSVPEPGVMVLLATGLAAAWRRRHAS